MTNPVLEAIKNRRTVLNYKEQTIEDEKIQAVLEAGLWAPSWLNKQPWRFIVVKEQGLKVKLSNFAATAHKAAVLEAPICIVVAVNTKEDPYHFIEAGAAATQNMALAAYSLGLSSTWVGIFDLKKEKGSSEEKVKDILNIPNDHRVVAILPIGISKIVPTKKRKPLSQLVNENRFD